MIKANTDTIKQEEERVYLNPTVIRIWHWINAFGIVTLCLTGIQIRFPDHFHLFGAYRNAIRLHDTAGIVVSILYLVWLVYYLLVSKKLRKIYIPTLQDIKEGMPRQARYYLFDYFRGKPNPHVSTPDSKFNPLQKSAYTMFMLVFTPLVIISGLLLLNIMPLRRWILMVGGLRLLIGAHFLIACCFLAFLFAHVYLATMGHSILAHFKAMWTGWEDVEAHPAHHPEKETAYVSNTSGSSIS